MEQDAKKETESSTVDALPTADNLSDSNPVKGFSDLTDEMAQIVSDRNSDNEPESEVEQEVEQEVESKDLHKNPRFQQVISQKNQALAEKEELATKLSDKEAELETLKKKSEEVIEEEIDEDDPNFDPDIYNMVKKKVKTEFQKANKEIKVLKEQLNKVTNKQLEDDKKAEKRSAEVSKQQLAKEVKDLTTKTKDEEYEFDLKEHYETLNDIRDKFPAMSVEESFKWAVMNGKIKPNSKVVKEHETLKSEIFDAASKSDDTGLSNTFILDKREVYSDMKEAMRNAAENLDKKGIKHTVS